MIFVIRHFAIEVSDLTLAFKFYVSLGFSMYYHALENWSVGEHKDVRHIVKLRPLGGGAILEIIERYPSFDIQPTAYSNTHICFQCKDIEATCKDLEAKGCTVVTPLRLSPDKSVRLAFYKDPFGLTLEIVEACNANSGDNSSESRVEAHPEQKSCAGERALNFGVDYQGGPTTTA